MANEITMAQRELQEALDQGRYEDLAAFKVALRDHEMVFTRTGRRGKKKCYAAAEAKGGRSLRFILPFYVEKEGGRRRTFYPFEGEPAVLEDHEVQGHNVLTIYVYGLFVKVGSTNAAYIGTTEQLARTFYEAGQPTAKRREWTRLLRWAARERSVVHAAVLGADWWEGEPERTRAAVEVSRLRWARTAALAGYELPGRRSWCPRVGEAEPYDGGWPMEELHEKLRPLSDLAAPQKGEASLRLADFTLEEAFWTLPWW